MKPWKKFSGILFELKLNFLEKQVTIVIAGVFLRNQYQILPGMKTLFHPIKWIKPFLTMGPRSNERRSSFSLIFVINLNPRLHISVFSRKNGTNKSIFT